jgi:RimJ/RimL family protein N-acetyltransferase
VRVEPISLTTRSAALEYLARSPYLNVFIIHILLHEITERSRERVIVAVDDGDRIRGVAYSGRQLVVAADSSAIEAIAQRVRHGRERMIVGPRDQVQVLWGHIAAWRDTPRLVRERQFVMAVDRERLRPYDARVEVRHAAPGEWGAVADGSAAMIAQEREYDPRRASHDFTLGIRQMIERRLWWVGVDAGRLCFFCNVGPWSEQTAQLQGIWTPPELRGHGLATQSLAAICDRLLDVSPTLSLYVNDFNSDAVALYRRVGFESVGEFQTILF